MTSGWQHIKMPGINKKVQQFFKNLQHRNYGTTVFKLPSPIAYECVINDRSAGVMPL